jgi:hypothetical protein
MIAPIDSSRSGLPVGFTRAGKRRLVTAHIRSGQIRSQNSNRLAGHLRFCTISFPTARKVARDIDNRAVSQILAGLSSDREF